MQASSCTQNIPFLSDILSSDHIMVVFDKNLNYVMVNEALCELLNKKTSELIGKNILELYPQITASNNHRNLLKAVTGQTVMDMIEGNNGELFKSTYHPLSVQGEVEYVVVKSVKQTTRR